VIKWFMDVSGSQKAVLLIVVGIWSVLVKGVSVQGNGEAKSPLGVGYHTIGGSLVHLFAFLKQKRGLGIHSSQYYLKCGKECFCGFNVRRTGAVMILYLSKRF